jgi:hypothetical protein
MNDNVAQFPQLKLFSLPALAKEASERRLELGVRGDARSVLIAMQHIKDGVTRLGYRWLQQTA